MRSPPLAWMAASGDDLEILSTCTDVPTKTTPNFAFFHGLVHWRCYGESLSLYYSCLILKWSIDCNLQSPCQITKRYAEFPCLPIHQKHSHRKPKEIGCPEDHFPQKLAFSCSVKNTHRLHVWYIYLQNWVIFRANVGNYSIHGAYGIWIRLDKYVHKHKYIIYN